MCFIDDEAEVNNAARLAVADLTENVDLMFMLHMQASSIEALINSTY